MQVYLASFPDIIERNRMLQDTTYFFIYELQNEACLAESIRFQLVKAYRLCEVLMTFKRIRNWWAVSLTTSNWYLVHQYSKNSLHYRIEFRAQTHWSSDPVGRIISTPCSWKVLLVTRNIISNIHLNCCALETPKVKRNWKNSRSRSVN